MQQLGGTEYVECPDFFDRSDTKYRFEPNHKPQNIKEFMELHKLMHRQAFYLPSICDEWAIFTIDEGLGVTVSLVEDSKAASLWSCNCNELCDHAWRHICSGEAKMKLYEPPTSLEMKMESDKILEYLDGCIRYWRKKAKASKDDINAYTMAICYVDAFQSMRSSVYGETLPQDPETEIPGPRNFIKDFMEFHNLKPNQPFLLPVVFQARAAFMIDNEYRLCFQAIPVGGDDKWEVIEDCDNTIFVRAWRYIMTGQYRYIKTDPDWGTSKQHPTFPNEIPIAWAQQQENFMQLFLEHHKLEPHQEFIFKDFKLHRFMIDKDSRIVILMGIDGCKKEWGGLDESLHPEHKIIWDRIQSGSYGEIVKI